MQLKLTGKELEFLIYVQYQDDWYWQAFPEVLERFKGEFSGNTSLPDLQAKLRELPEEKMLNLQLALLNLCEVNLVMSDSNATLTN